MYFNIQTNSKSHEIGIQTGAENALLFPPQTLLIYKQHIQFYSK